MSDADKHIKKIMQELLKADGVPTGSKVKCPRCESPAKFVDHGPHVGKGWYCVVCKDDVDHYENTYGLSGKSRVRPYSEMSLSGGSFQYVQLNCTNSFCKACGGAAIQRPSVPVSRGDLLLVTNNIGAPSLVVDSAYKVSEVTPKGIKTLVPHGMFLIEQEYARCRFRKAIVTSMSA